MKMNPKNMLKKSISAFGKKLFEYVKEFHSERLTDWEFGTFDHSWLSILLATWIKTHKDAYTGVNGMFDSREEHDRAYQSLIDGFEYMATDWNGNGNDPRYLETMSLFVKYYPTFWD